MTSGEGAGWAERETSLRLSRAFHVENKLPNPRLFIQSMERQNRQ